MNRHDLDLIEIDEKAGAERERKAIVAWLRENAADRMQAKLDADVMSFHYYCREAEQQELEEQADLIEAGEHLK